MGPANENEVLSGILDSHLRAMVDRLSKIPADMWDWTPDPAAPTARTLATHAWQWLICDRQHIAEPDARKHARVPEPPPDPDGMCLVLAEEADRWKELVLSLTPEDLARPLSQFNGDREWNVRWFVGHMVQNVIYKSGQLSYIYFALGLDGTEPYDCPFPNRIYDWLATRDNAQS